VYCSLYILTIFESLVIHSLCPQILQKLLFPIVLGIFSHPGTFQNNNLSTFITISFFLVRDRICRENRQQCKQFCIHVSLMYFVVQFYPWFKFYFPLFWGMVMYKNAFEIKENKIIFYFILLDSPIIGRVNATA